MLTASFPKDPYYTTSLGWDERKITCPELANLLAWRMNYPVNTTDGEMTNYVASLNNGYVRIPVNESDPEHLKFKNNILFSFIIKGTPLQEAIVKLFTKSASGGLGYTHVRYNPNGTSEIDKLEFSLDNAFSTTKTIKQLVIENGIGTLSVSGETGNGSVANLPNNLFGEDSTDTTNDKFAVINSFLYENIYYDYLVPDIELEKKTKDNYVILYDKDTKYLKGENLIYIKTDEFIDHGGANTHKMLIFDEDEGITLAKQKDIEIGLDDNVMAYICRSNSANDAEDIMGLNTNNILSYDSNGYLVTKPNSQVAIKFDQLDERLGDIGGIYNKAINNSQIEIKNPLNDGKYGFYCSMLVYSDKTTHFPFDATFRMIHKNGGDETEKVLSVQKVVFDKVIYERVILSGIMVMDMNDKVFISMQSSMGAGGVQILKDDIERYSTFIVFKLSNL